MKWKYLLILITLLVIPPAFASHAEGRGLFIYTYTVKESGWIDITTEFESKSSGFTWVLVPKFRNYNMTVISGSITNSKLIENTSYYFYSNLTFSYTPRTKVLISWSYRFGALIVEPNGAFFSTQIAFNPEDDAIVLVKLPNKFIPKGIEPKGYEITKENEFNLVRYRLNGATNNTMRVLISFSVQGSQKFEEKGVGKLKIKYPPRYQDVVENITKYYKTTLPLIEKYTSVNEEIPVEVKLFVPATMEEITTLGYTGPRYTSDVITRGVINLNMMLVRMPYYELPTTFVHELLHQYMQVAGLSVDLRWAHEGLAQYLSDVIVEEALGYKVPEDINVEAVIAQTGGDFSFLVEWHGGGLPGNPGLYYSASEILIRDFAKRYGGPDVYRKFFSNVRRDKAVVDDLPKFVKYLSEAAGKDVSGFFESYGIKAKLLDKETLELIQTAEKYAKSTYWFNLASGEALKILHEQRTREGALISIMLVFLGLTIDALALSIPIGLVITLKTRKKGGETNEESNVGDLEYSL